MELDIAKADMTLSDLLALAEAGQPVVITRAGAPVAEVWRVEPQGVGPHRRIGALAHLGLLNDDEACAFLTPKSGA